jgi:L-alanine-DL-glutamate epimerase-like enolase superfamily enzyme
MLQMVSVCPATDKYHEFKMFETPDANGTIIPMESKAEKFESIDGVIKVPSGAGMGVTIDPAYINTHKLISG